LQRVSPLKDVLETLEETNYNGTITSELLPREIEGDFREMNDYLYMARVFIRTGINTRPQLNPREVVYGV